MDQKEIFYLSITGVGIIIAVGAFGCAAFNLGMNSLWMLPGCDTSKEGTKILAFMLGSWFLIVASGIVAFGVWISKAVSEQVAAGDQKNDR